MKRPLKPGVFGAAQFETFDGVRVARLRLDRWWDPTLVLDDVYRRPADDRYRPLVVIATNPSDACAEQDDNTSAKCTTYAKREGANGLVMVNVHPGISTKPSELCNVLLPYGCDDRHWEAVDAALCENAVAIVPAWGKRPAKMSPVAWQDRIRKLRDIAADVGGPLFCFGTNGDGSPKHPLYLPADQPLVPFDFARSVLGA